MHGQNATLTSALLLVSLLLCFTSTDVIPVASALWLTIPTSGQRCVYEEIQNNVVVLGYYHVIQHEGNVTLESYPTVNALVSSPYGKTLHHQENTTGAQFAFTTSEVGNYFACFRLDTQRHNPKEVTLGLEWMVGIAAKDWDAIAKKEHIEGVDLELKKLHSGIEGIQVNMMRIQIREAERREFNDKTNERVAWLSITSIGVCIFTSVLQLWHLKRYFSKKHLI